MKLKSLYFNPVKKAKDQNNAKTKMADTRRKLNTLMVQLKSLNLEQFKLNNDRQCAGKTVREMTDYFENISKCDKRGWVSCDLKKNNPITSIPKPSIPYPRKKRSNTTNLQFVWRDLMMQRNFYYKSITDSNALKATNVLHTVRDSLRNSLMTCFMMLQYII